MITLALDAPAAMVPQPGRAWLFTTAVATPFVIALEFYLLMASLLFFSAGDGVAFAYGVALLAIGGLAAGGILGGAQTLALRPAGLAPWPWVSATALAFGGQALVWGLVLGGLFALGAGPLLANASGTGQTAAALGAFALGGAIQGLLLGMAQWLRLRTRFVQGRGAWLGANGIGWLLAVPLPFLLLVAGPAPTGGLGAALWLVATFLLAAVPYVLATTWAARKLRG